MLTFAKTSLLVSLKNPAAVVQEQYKFEYFLKQLHTKTVGFSAIMCINVISRYIVGTLTTSLYQWHAPGNADPFNFSIFSSDRSLLTQIALYLLGSGRFKAGQNVHLKHWSHMF